MYSFLSVGGCFAVFILVNVLMVSNHREHPPFIEKGENGKKNKECYIVFVWAVIPRGSGGYHQYNFVKRKNGKYRLKFYPVREWISGLLFLSLYIWLIKNAWDSILKYPGTILPLYLLFLIVWLNSLILLNSDTIVARICFHKYMKGHKKSKRC